MGHMVHNVLLRRGIRCVEASEDICSIDKAVAAQSVCIDFTTPDAFRSNYPFLAEHFKAVVVGTTGWNDIRDEVFACFNSFGTPMIYASNFSLGVTALSAAVETACRILRDHGYDAHINEVHHIHKLDAPSGTAKSLASIVEKCLGVEATVSSQRIGEVPGIHTVEFGSSCDKLVFSHEALSREGLAEGAVAAALLTEGLEGVHEFRDLLTI